jgi:hypothetical protein
MLIEGILIEYYRLIDRMNRSQMNKLAIAWALNTWVDFIQYCGMPEHFILQGWMPLLSLYNVSVFIVAIFLWWVVSDLIFKIYFSFQESIMKLSFTSRKIFFVSAFGILTAKTIVSIIS